MKKDYKKILYETKDQILQLDQKYKDLKTEYQLIKNKQKDMEKKAKNISSSILFNLGGKIDAIGIKYTALIIKKNNLECLIDLKSENDLIVSNRLKKIIKKLEQDV